MKNKKVFDVAVKMCEECQGYDVSFCANCGSEVDAHNRCGECNRFVKTTPCTNCYGNAVEAEYRVGDKCSLFVSRHSIQEIKDHVGFKGDKFKTYSAKVIKITGHESAIVRVKGKEIDVSTDDLME
ncbi:MAG TPA: hypothetical protein PLP63_06445 [Saprospiraceae bacterium]|nr:hypothetical protein [Saprospiraceae bacterium]